MGSGLCESELKEAVRRFFGGLLDLSTLGCSSGFSGSGFARIETDGRSWCLRRWPPGFEERRLRFIHRALLHARANGFDGVPALRRTDEGDTILAFDGRLFDV